MTSMLSAGFLLLKICLIVFLVIFSILLILAVSILFVPLRYRGKLIYCKTFHATFEASWLFRFLQLRLSYSDHSEMTFKILGFSVFGNKAKAKKRTEAQKTNETRSLKKRVEKEAEREEKKKAQSGSKEKKRTIPEKTSLNERAWKCLQTLEKHRDRLDGWIAFFKKNTTQRALHLIKDKVLRVLREIFPKQLDGELCIGMEDPFTMGQICTAAAFFFPFFSENLTFKPLFFENKTEADIKFQGGIHLYVLFAAALQLWFHKDFQSAYKAYQKNKRDKEQIVKREQTKQQYAMEENYG